MKPLNTSNFLNSEYTSTDPTNPLANGVYMKAFLKTFVECMGEGEQQGFVFINVTKHSHLGLNEFGKKKQITKFLVRASLHISLCKLISHYSLRYYVIKK